jgi:H+/Cl- antiporter ClcA
MSDLTNWKALIGIISGLCTAIISLFVMFYFFDRKLRYKKKSRGLLWFAIILILSMILVIVPFIGLENSFLRPVLDISYILFPVIDVLLLVFGFRLAFRDLNSSRRRSYKRKHAN